MANEIDALRECLWKVYLEEITQGRHHETQRVNVTNLVIAVAAAILALATFDKALNRSDLPLTIFLIVLGMFGAAFSSKHYERFRKHMLCARNYRNAIDATLPNLSILDTTGNESLTKAVTSVPSKDALSTKPLKILKQAAGIEHRNFPASFDGGIQRSWMRFIHKRHLYQMWLTFHLLIAMLGVVLSIIAAFFPQRAA